jgi:Ca-activated chloride channel homolog
MITNDDPRLAAYALGEMNDAGRAAFEAELAELQATDPAAKTAVEAEIESIRAVATTLTGELKADADVAWASHPSLASAGEHGRDVRATTSRRRAVRWILAAAASVVVAGIVYRTVSPQFQIAYAASQKLAAGESDGQTRMADPPSGNLGTAIRGGAEQLGWKLASNAASAPASPKEMQFGQAITGGKDANKLNGVRLPALDAAGKALSSGHVPGSFFDRQYSRLDKNDSVMSPDADGDGIADNKLAPVVAAGMMAESRNEVAIAEDQLQRARKLIEGRTENVDASVRLGVSAGTPTDAEKKLVDRMMAEGEGVARFKDASGRGRSEAQEKELRDSLLVVIREQQRTSAESYAAIHDNTFLDPRSSPLSTFGIDVDTASYSNIRRYLESGQRPPADAVRIEELVNYFPTHDAPPTDGRPFAVRMEVAACPWQPEHRLVRVALKGQIVAKEARPPSNLVFLVDVSGSMNQENKLPLVKRSLRKLVGQLGENDRVAIVVYAGSSGLALPSTNASDKTTILAAIDKLEAGGSTNGGQGIELAYSTAMEHLARDAGSNRVILCTDGDFNVGVTDRGQLFNLIAEKAKAGVFLNVLGFGTGNTKDDTMEGLADKGNGQYGYIDSDREADKVFVEGLAGTLVTIAKDVKLQLEFNPGTVKSYRLIGYENRVMAAQDFNNDLKDSGDLGAGHNVVALYEIDPARGGAINDPVKVEPALKYQPQPKAEEVTRLIAPGANTTELLTLKLRYKRPDAPLEQGTSELIETTLDDRADASIGAASDDMRFAAAVAGFGMMLRESPSRGACTWDLVRSLARGGIGDDVGGHRSEFLNLIDAAQKTRP